MENTNFENMLIDLIPAKAKLDPAAAAFEAGFRKGHQKARLWQLSSGCFALLVVIMAVLTLSGVGGSQSEGQSTTYLANASNMTTIRHSMELQMNDVDMPPKELNKNSYLLLRRKVLEHGVDALPKSNGGSGRVYTLRDVIQS